MTDSERLTAIERRAVATNSALAELRETTGRIHALCVKLVDWSQEKPTSDLGDALRALGDAVLAIDPRLAALDTRLGALDAKIEALDAKIEALSRHS